ncbi:MAG: PRD domain-containing protein [Clostridiaceae bacterium]|nr:PRD domain-containing protein [Clostridiaceae bacterium]
MQTKTKYLIEKVMNNNVVLVTDLQSNHEMILIGRGLGFGKKDKTIVEFDNAQIDKAFLTFNKKLKEEYFALISQLDESVIDICEEIITIAEQNLGKLNDHLHIVLTDHVGFALERIKLGIEIENPFLFDIKSLYPHEFEIGKRGAEIIKERLGIQISESEMGFIALYLQSARQNKTITETVQDTRILKEAVDIVEEAFDIRINPEEPAYIRFINHLKLKTNQIQIEKYAVNPLLKTIKEQFKDSFNIAIKIADHIRKNKDIDISEDELGYMAIHIERMRTFAKS